MFLGDRYALFLGEEWRNLHKVLPLPHGAGSSLQPPSTMAASQPDVEDICKVQFPCVNLFEFRMLPPQMPVTTRIIFILVGDAFIYHCYWSGSPMHHEWLEIVSSKCIFEFDRFFSLEWYGNYCIQLL